MVFKRVSIDYHLLAPCLLSLLLPLLHLYCINETPASQNPIVDSGEYVQVAKEIVRSSFKFTNTDHLSSLYVWLLSFIFFVTGNSLTAVKLFQILLNCASLIIFFSVAKKSFSRKSALVAAYIWAFYGPIIFFTCEIMSVSLILFLYVSSLYMLLLAKEKESPVWWALTGLVFGLAALTRPEILGFSSLVLFGFIFSALRDRPVHYRSLLNGLLFWALLASPILFTGIQNKRVYGTFTMLPTASGVNFYMGNNPDFEKSIGSRPGPYWDSLADLPLKEDSIGNSFNYERNYFFYKKVLLHAIEHPAQYMRALSYKLRTLLNGYELPAVFSIYESRSRSFILELLVRNISGFFFPFAFILPLAFLGVVVSWGRWGEQRWILLMWISFIFPLIGYWNSGRFRMVILPFVILYASSGLVSLLNSLRDREVGRFRTKAIGVILLGFLFNTPYFHFSRNYNFQAEALTFAGIEMALKDGRVEEGVDLLDRSLEIQKGNEEKCAPIGFLKGQSQTCDDILKEHQTTLKALTYSYKGDAMMLQKKYDKAASLYSVAIEIKPDFSVAYNNLGAALLDMNQIEKAFASFKRALKIKPHNAFAHKNLANILVYKDRTDEAITHFNEALKVDPFDSEIYYRLGKVYEKMGRRREAADYYMTSLRIREIY